ncbi:MAG: methionyl-tRNA formyltransferase [Deltaproteobacteria bacterium]|nr:methionyl-tRNA formyltransferase [Deltaproteobacteria bacterium]
MARLAFFGTPELAATCLGALLDQTRHDVVAVVCQPDRPQGRGHKLEAPPVKKLALERKLPILQPETLKKDTVDGDGFFSAFSELKVDLAIVAAYGRIIPKRVLALPPREFVNVHGSLLPRWRGAAPIQRAIQAGDAETGICLMHMVQALDAGDVYATGRVRIDDDDDGASLTLKMAALGGSMLREHLDALVEGALPRVPQPADGLTYAEMLKKEEARLDFTAPMRAVFNHARAMQPWPGTAIELEGEQLKLFGARPTDLDTSSVVPGTLVDVDANLGAVFACSDRGIAFAQVQRPNKGRLSAVQWAASRSKG